jgi:hypothetical protein
MTPDENAKNLRVGCFGCLGFIALLAVVAIVGTIVYKSQPTSLNDASRYAQRCHDLLYADAAATSFLMRADEHTPEELYEVADRMADDAGNAASAIDAPSGFTDSGDAFEKYAERLQDSYRKIADLLNDPTLEHSVSMTKTARESTFYLKEAITAFKRDLAISHFSKREKQRILNRLI